MLNHVIVPLDGSLLAQTALDHALQLLGEDSQITLLTVLQPQEVALSDFYPSTMIPKSIEDENGMRLAMARAQNYLKQLTTDIALQHPFHVNTRVEVGDAATVITQVAEGLHVDAIVMSTHGRSGIGRWLFGSVTQKVLAAADCPVFVVPARAHEEIKTHDSLKSLFMA